MGKIVPFESQEPPFTLDEAVKKIHELAKKSTNVFIISNHAEKRAETRNATLRQISDVLKHGKGVDGPTQDEHGNWRVKIKHYTCGRTVQVVVAFKGDRLIIVTVI